MPSAKLKTYESPGPFRGLDPLMAEARPDRNDKGFERRWGR